MSFTSSSTSGTTEFVYDVTAGIPAVIEETGPVYYIREPNGSLIARVDGETINYYHFDALGSTRLLTNSSGTVTDEYTYDGWGNLTNHTQNEGSVSQPYQYVGQLGYYTHVQDTNFPLLQLGVRMYDPEIGRFTQKDPTGDGANQYAYANANPNSNIDANGLACTPVGRAMRDSEADVPPPAFVRHMRTQSFWKKIGWEITGAIGWGEYDQEVACTCKWQRYGAQIDLWKRYSAWKQQMSCQTWTPCGYSLPWRYWNRWTNIEFFQVVGNEFYMPTLPTYVETTQGMLVHAPGEGFDCLCPAPAPPTSFP